MFTEMPALYKSSASDDTIILRADRSWVRWVAPAAEQLAAFDPLWRTQVDLRSRGLVSL